MMKGTYATKNIIWLEHRTHRLPVGRSNDWASKLDLELIAIDTKNMCTVADLKISRQDKNN